MTCPVCGGKSTVVCCRKDCETVVRRRKCVECGYIFYTEETETKRRTWQEAERKYREEKEEK